MDCPAKNIENNSLLVDYSTGKISPELCAQVERHVRSCAECNSVLTAQKKVSDALGAWEPPSISEDFNQRLYARVQALESAPTWRHRFAQSLGWRPALSLAGAAAAFTVALMVYAPADRQTPDPAPSESTRTEAIEPEQVERALEDLDMLNQLSSSNVQNL